MFQEVKSINCVTKKSEIQWGDSEGHRHCHPIRQPWPEAEPKAFVKMEGKHSLQEVVLTSSLTLWHMYPLTCIHTNYSNKLNVFLIWHIDTPNKCNMLTIFNWCRDNVTIIVLNEYEELKFWMDGLACQKQWYMFFSLCMCLWV